MQCRLFGAMETGPHSFRHKFLKSEGRNAEANNHHRGNRKLGR
jgi:hypothetical protein